MELNITGLETAGHDELLKQWRSVIGRPPPKAYQQKLTNPDISLGTAIGSLSWITPWVI